MMLWAISEPRFCQITDIVPELSSLALNDLAPRKRPPRCRRHPARRHHCHQHLRLFLWHHVEGSKRSGRQWKFFLPASPIGSASQNPESDAAAAANERTNERHEEEGTSQCEAGQGTFGVLLTAFRNFYFL